MKPSSPSHDTITQQARELWEQRGRPQGQDVAIWLEAERQLQARAAETAADPLATAAKADRRKQASRAPQSPTKTNAPKPELPATGKPLWPKPHSR